MKFTRLAPIEHIRQLQGEIYEMTHDVNFKNATSTGEIVQSALNFMIRNYKIEE